MKIHIHTHIHNSTCIILSVKYSNHVNTDFIVARFARLAQFSIPISNSIIRHNSIFVHKTRISSPLYDRTYIMLYIYSSKTHQMLLDYFHTYSFHKCSLIGRTQNGLYIKFSYRSTDSKSIIPCMTNHPIPAPTTIERYYDGWTHRACEIMFLHVKLFVHLLHNEKCLISTMRRCSWLCQLQSTSANYFNRVYAIFISPMWILHLQLWELIAFYTILAMSVYYLLSANRYKQRHCQSEVHFHVIRLTWLCMYKNILYLCTLRLLLSIHKIHLKCSIIITLDKQNAVTPVQ